MDKTGGGGGGGGSGGTQQQQQQQRERQASVSLWQSVIAALLMLCLVSYALMGTEEEHHRRAPVPLLDEHDLERVEQFAASQAAIDRRRAELHEKLAAPQAPADHHLAAHAAGHDDAEKGDRFKYWRDVYDEPERAFPVQRKFLVFDTWRGGFNNERMSLELAAIMAYLTNRTLVLPPPFNVYLLTFSRLEDYFELADMKRGMSVLSYEEFVDEYARRHPDAPPLSKARLEPDILRVATRAEGPSTTNLVWAYPDVPSDARERARLDRFRLHRQHVAPVYVNATVRDAEVIYFGQRYLFAHFYRAFYYSTRDAERHVRDWVRRHIHYRNRFTVFADAYLAELPANFSCVHYRRGDFQYKAESQRPPAEVYEHIKFVLEPNEPLYFASDAKEAEMNEAKAVFERAGHKVYSFATEPRLRAALADLDKHYYGMVEQMVCAASNVRRFVGTRLSTFSGYIYRMRGYFDRPANLDFFVTSHTRADYIKGFQAPPWAPPSQGAGCEWCVDFPAAWRDWEDESMSDALHPKAMP